MTFSHDLNLSKKQAELVGSNVEGLNLIHGSTKVCFFRNRQNELQNFYSFEKRLVLCNNLYSAVEALGHEHTTEQRLFIGASKNSLKAVLLHSENRLSSVPLDMPLM